MLETAGSVPSAEKTSIAEVTMKNFSAEVLQASREKPVLVDFWAPWCGPCKQLAPVLERVAKAAGDRLKIVKMNIDEHPAVAGQLGIQSIPAVIAFVKGQPADGFMGALPEAQILAFVERLVGPLGSLGADALIDEAGRALEAGDVATAAELYATALMEDDKNVPARVGLARAQLRAGQTELAETTLAGVPAAKQNDSAVAAVRAEIALAAQTASLGDAAELRARVDADPADHQARFDLALALAGRNAREEAAAELLEIIRRDRAWNDDGARKQLVQLFDAWGPTDPATIAGRRRLSSILFA
jgi:putative thioredoxin